MVLIVNGFLQIAGDCDELAMVVLLDELGFCFG
jgi:hypothetical protein